jgi:predicted nucleic acid-binding protein
VIYLDTSVALAQLFAEDRRPPAALWEEAALVSSRLLEVELWTRLHGRGATRSHAEAAREILARVALVELAPPVLARAVEPFPVAVRTLDALHLSTALFLAGRNQDLSIAAYDERLLRAAAAVGLRRAKV